jgi:ribosome recycling factor
MFDKDGLLDSLKKRMDGALATFDQHLKGLRTGRASPSLLENISVEAYGSRMHLNELATVTVPEARTLTVQVWDKVNVKPVEKAIANSDLGLSPSSDGNVIRVQLPNLSEERRQELAKVARKFAEQTKIAIRNIRRDGIDLVKKEKNKEMSEDEQHKISDMIQSITDKYEQKIDSIVQAKEKEIKQG